MFQFAIDAVVPSVLVSDHDHSGNGPVGISVLFVGMEFTGCKPIASLAEWTGQLNAQPTNVVTILATILKTVVTALDAENCGRIHKEPPHESAQIFRFIGEWKIPRKFHERDSDLVMACDGL